MEIFEEMKILKAGDKSELTKKNIYEEPKKLFDNEEELIIKGFGYFNEVGDHRYLLEINIDNGRQEKIKEITVIMLNPSHYGENYKNIFVDRTITNVIKIANDNGYNQVNVLNLFSEIQSNSNKVDFKNLDEENINFIIQYIEQNNNDIFLAWGYRFPYNTKKIEALIGSLKQRKNIFVLNKELNYPKHPGRMSIDSCRKNYGNDKKVMLKQLNLEIYLKNNGLDKLK